MGCGGATWKSGWIIYDTLEGSGKTVGPLRDVWGLINSVASLFCGRVDLILLFQVKWSYFSSGLLAETTELTYILTLVLERLWVVHLLWYKLHFTTYSDSESILPSGSILCCIATWFMRKYYNCSKKASIGREHSRSKWKVNQSHFSGSPVLETISISSLFRPLLSFVGYYLYLFKKFNVLLRYTSSVTGYLGGFEILIDILRSPLVWRSALGLGTSWKIPSRNIDK